MVVFPPCDPPVHLLCGKSLWLSPSSLYFSLRFSVYFRDEVPGPTPLGWLFSSARVTLVSRCYIIHQPKSGSPGNGDFDFSFQRPLSFFLCGVFLPGSLSKLSRRESESFADRVRHHAAIPFFSNAVLLPISLFPSLPPPTNRLDCLMHVACSFAWWLCPSHFSAYQVLPCTLSQAFPIRLGPLSFPANIPPVCFRGVWLNHSLPSPMAFLNCSRPLP